jgi:DNA-binding NarL/FixJ family response regulator
MSKPRLSGLRILLTEDHVTTRLGIKQLLQEEFRGVVFGEAGTARETIALLKTQTWDLVILDINLPDRHGLEVLQEARQHWPGLPVLIFSAHPEDQFAVHGVRAHAAGYLTKERAPEELGLAVRKILSGGKYLSPWLAARLAEHEMAGRGGLPHEALSEREFQVLRLSAAGKAGKAIAGELGLSEKTVSTYRMRVMKKHRVASGAELIHYAVRHGLVGEPSQGQPGRVGRRKPHAS